MVCFKDISIQTFLTDYWQKKPLVIRQALPNFHNPLSPDELAGLAMEEDVESRIITETPEKAPFWHLKRGPFKNNDFKRLPKTHWTLLVQAVDRFIPEVAALLDHFDFLPQWRVDDIMISYAVDQGNVGPHYDNYDVFLYQAMGTRRWSLTTKNCHKENHLSGIELRIMEHFETEEEYVLEEGDMLYLPPHVGHHGVSSSADCMTYSFGYRSYQGQELLDSFAEHLAENKQAEVLYKDPNWSVLNATSELPKQAWENARELMLKLLSDEAQFKSWFGCFATHLDQHAEELLPEPLGQEIVLAEFMQGLNESRGMVRNPLCRFSYQLENESLKFYANGYIWDIDNVSWELVKLIANCRALPLDKLQPFLKHSDDQCFLFLFWKMQWLEIMED